jgi:hypothetical protein
MKFSAMVRFETSLDKLVAFQSEAYKTFFYSGEGVIVIDSFCDKLATGSRIAGRTCTLSKTRCQGWEKGVNWRRGRVRCYSTVKICLSLQH